MSFNSKKEYKIVKNIVHNDIGITKDNIEKLISKEICRQVDKYFKNIVFESLIKSEILKRYCDNNRNYLLSDDVRLMINDAEQSVINMRNKAIEKAIRDNIIVSLKNDLDKEN